MVNVLGGDLDPKEAHAEQGSVLLGKPQHPKHALSFGKHLTEGRPIAPWSSMAMQSRLLCSQDCYLCQALLGV